MTQEMIERINTLAKKSREVGLTEEEKAEQQKLRQEYIAAFRGNLKKQLDNIEVIRPDGTRESLKGKKS